MPTTYFVDTAVGNDANAGTSAGAGNAWATIGKATATIAAGDLCYVKASGNYNEAVACATTSGGANTPLTFEGYTSATGDGGQVTVDGQNSRANCLTTNGKTNYIWRNFIFTGATTRAFDNTSNSTGYWSFYNCRFTKGSSTPATGIGSSTSSSGISLILVNCRLDNFSGNALDNWYYVQIEGCVFHTNAIGFNEPAFLGKCTVTRSLFRDNSTAGIALATDSDLMNVLECSFRANGDGIRVHGANHRTVLLMNNTHSGNTGYDVNVQNTPSGTTLIYADYNSMKTGTSGQYHNWSAGGHDVTLTADPFTSSTNLSLNATAGGGAAVKAVGFPGAFLDGTTTGYLDGGAVQHQDSGGSAGMLFIPNLDGV